MTPARRLFATLAAALLLTLATAVPAVGEGSFGAIRVWGSAGAGSGQFSNVIGDFVGGPNGEVYVADGANNRVQVFSPAGDFLFAFGSDGLGNGQFSLVENVAVSNGYILVTDCYGGRLQQFTLDGKFVRSYGSYGSGVNQFACPEDIAVAPNGHVFVLDTFNQRVKEFSWSGASAASAASITPQTPMLTLVSATGPGELTDPGAIAVDGSGTLIVGEVDPHTCTDARIREFAADGTFLRQWGTPGGNPGELRCILSIAVDAANNVLIGDWGYLQAFTRDGQFAAVLASYGTSPGQFVGPLGIAADANCNLYVTDRDNNRVQELGWSEAPFCRALPPAPPPAAPSPSGPAPTAPTVPALTPSIVSPPVLSLATQVQHPLQSRTIKVRVTCTAPAPCRVSMRIRMKLLHHVYFLTSRTKALLPARPATLSVPIRRSLIPALTRELARGRTLRVSAYVSAVSSRLGSTKAIGVKLVR